MNVGRCFQQAFTVSYVLVMFSPICFVSTAFSWAQGTTQNETPFEVRAIVDAGSKYRNHVVVVHGCYVRDFEVRVLQPCGSKFNQFDKYSIWLDNDGRADFGKLEATRNYPMPVILKGEFQTGRGRQYGHLDAYRHRLIVHELLWHDEPPKRP
jgi:hypothetical protein